MNKKRNLTIKETFALAMQNHQKNNFKIAHNLYSEILKTNPNHFESIFYLGSLSVQTKDFDVAKSLLQKAIEIQPNFVKAHNNLGIVFRELRQFEKAMSYFQKANEIQPNFKQAYNNLGTVLKELGEYNKAKGCYEKAIKIDPNYADAHNNLGVVFNELGENQKAVSCYEKAIQIEPNYVAAHNNLGVAFMKLEEHHKAVSCYEKAIQIEPNYVAAHNNLGIVFKKLGEHQKAMNCYEKAIQIEPSNLTSHWLSMNTFPIIYENLKEIGFYRKRFEDSIKKINQLLDTQSKYTKQQMIDAVSSSTNFYLHYQGGNDLKLQIEYGKLIERLTQKIYPQFHQKRKKNKAPKYIKIGFISAYFRSHSISKTHKNWILKLDQKFIKKFVYYVGERFDHITNTIKEHVDNFYSHTDVDHLANQISKDDLDVLIYLDIGMDPKMQILGSLRLASVQCIAMGHPVTSGLKNIDYALSCELMEPHNAHSHYTEKLIKLPNTGQCYEEPNFNNNGTKILSKKHNNIIFFNLQSLFKLLPQDDHIYLDILKKQPNSCFWFIQGKGNLITSIFKERISKLFQNHNLSLDEYFVFHPRCQYNEFLGLIEQSDIILDSINWSGNNSTHEAISLNKPIVTLPGSFMRGRHTYSVLKILDIEDTIANSKEKYVEIAVKLAKDNNFRNSITKKIAKNKNKLFNDDKPIRFLEEVIRKKLLELT